MQEDQGLIVQTRQTSNSQQPRCDKTEVADSLTKYVSNYSVVTTSSVLIESLELSTLQYNSRADQIFLVRA